MSRARTAAPPPGAPERQRSRHGGRDRERDSPGSREWQILAVVLVGAFMAVLDTTIIKCGPAEHRVGPACPPGRPGVGRLGVRAPWSWACLGASVLAGAALALWEVRLARQSGEPVIQVRLMRRRSFAADQLLALLYFAGFTTLFFILSILWQQGLGVSALGTGLLIVPFALASLLSAANSDRFSTRFGRWTVIGGIGAMLAGQALVLLVLHLSTPAPTAWLLLGPLALAGLGNGLVIAPNQDFVLGSVPPSQAGTAGGALVTAQRIGAALGSRWSAPRCSAAAAARAAALSPCRCSCTPRSWRPGRIWRSSSRRCCARWPCRPPSVPSAPAENQ